MGVLTVELGVPYAGWPIRCADDYEFGLRSLPSELRTRIQAWAREFNEFFDEERGWRSDKARRTHFEEALALQGEVQRKLGSGYRVVLNHLGSGVPD